MLPISLLAAALTTGSTANGMGGWDTGARGRGDRRCLGPLEGGGKQVAGRQAAVRPPFLGDGEDLLLGGEVVELVRGPDGLTEREGAWHGPGTYPRNRGELAHELIVWQPAQDLGVQPAVRQPRGEVAERADLPPREPRLAELARNGSQ